MTNWQTKKLEDLTIKKGLVRGPFGGALKKEIFRSSGYKVYEQRNAIYQSTELGEYYIDDDKYEQLKRFSVKEGDFIVSCSGTIGRIFRIPKDAPEGVINQALLKITIDGGIVLPEYFYQYFKWDKFQSDVIDNTQGGAMQNLVGMDIFRSTKLQIPEKPEQERIVAILEVWDGYIEKLEQKIALKEQLKKGLMQQLLTGKRRLPGFNETWKDYRFSDIVDAKKGSGLSKEKLSDSGKKCILYGEIYTKYDEIIDEVQSKTSAIDGVASKANDVLVPASTTTSSLDVATATHVSEDNVMLGGDINILRPKTDINGKFLSLLLSGPEKINLAKRAQGITIVHLYGKDFIKMPVSLPSRDEQDAIVGVIETIRSEIKTLNPLLNELKLQKKYLLKNLITGTIRIPDTMKLFGSME